MAKDSEDALRGRHHFSTTQWSVVLDAAHSDPELAQAALEKLCGRYWYPVYAFLRQRGHDVHDAEDLTQGFFYFVIARRAFLSVNPQKGRFRTFLLTALTNFLHNERDREQARKRGGRHEIISLDEHLAEGIFRHEPVDDSPPERHFERNWANTLVRRVLDQLREEYGNRGKAALFAGLQPFLTGEPRVGDYEQLARQLASESGTIKVTLHRMRRRFGELLRCEVAHTVERSEEVEEEIRQLLAAIAD